MYTAEFKQLLKHLILLESTRFKRETGANAERWQEKLIRYEKAGGYFVHFSNIPKMGLFTRNKYGTPIGFYAYPLDRERMESFAVDRPYALIIKPKPEARLLDLRSYSNQDLSVDIQKLIGLKYSKARVEKASTEARVQTSGGKLWNITRVLSGADKADAFLKKVGKDKETRLPLKGGGPTGTWTMLFRKLGYDGVVDIGDGIIHPSEPAQAVFFDTTKLELVEVIEKPTDVSTKSELFAKNLQRRDLSGQDLSGEDFQGANLVVAILIGTNLYGANLEGANLRGANLQRANLEGANLVAANLVAANLQGADLEGANLRGANLYGANLEGANLRGANLQRANLEGANLVAANLVAANLQGAYLSRADLSRADLTSAVIADSTLLDKAKYNSQTKFPQNFDPEKRYMVKTD